MSNEILLKAKDKECLIIFDKTAITFFNEYEIKDNFIYVKEQKLSVEKTSVNYIKYSDSKESFKMSYRFPSATRGIIKSVIGKFIEVDIWDCTVDRYFSYIVPVGEIKGIKLGWEETDEELKVE